MIVAFQGIRGAYSEMAVWKHFGSKAQPMGCNNFDKVFEAVLKSQAAFGVIPVENTIAGTVVENYDLLLTHDIAVLAEIYMNISHMLLGKKGVRFSVIRKVVSHPHALNQCKAFLRRHHLKPIPSYDTAGSAQKVAQCHSQQWAAIASKLCADIYGLTVLKENIQSNIGNATRFFVIGNRSKMAISRLQGKTSLAFKTRHTPGALVDCLKVFQDHQLNLTKLESRPVPENPWEYVFYTDVEAGSHPEAVQNAVEALTSQALFVKILGSYPKAAF